MRTTVYAIVFTINVLSFVIETRATFISILEMTLIRIPIVAVITEISPLLRSVIIVATAVPLETAPARKIVRRNAVSPNTTFAVNCHEVKLRGFFPQIDC